MKNLSLFIILAMSVAFFSCERVEKAGNIPGMGDAPGALQAEMYEINEDLSFGDFIGISDNSASSVLKSASEEGDETIEYFYEFVQGSGDQVVLKVTITNNSDDCRTAWFRAGTVFKVNKSGYQNGILLAPVAVCIEGGTSKTVVLNLYCLNLGLEDSDETASYEFLGVTTSETMKRLLDRLRYKMINYEHYVAYSDISKYEEIRNQLQDIVWEITNGSGDIEQYMGFINDIPRIPHGVYPDGMYNEEPNLPNCDWCVPCSGTGALSYVAFITGCDGTPTPSSGSYSTNGFGFNVETNWKLNGEKLTGAIKFESIGDQIGEDGEVETGTFSFSASCGDLPIKVITKNKDFEYSIIDASNIGNVVAMANGFTVTFIGVEGNDSGDFTYTFRVTSDNCTGGKK